MKTNRIVMLAGLFLMSGVAIAQKQSNLATNQSAVVKPAVAAGAGFTLKWTGIERVEFSESDAQSYLTFEGASYSDAANPVPVFEYKQQLSSYSTNVEVTLLNPQYTVLTSEEAGLVGSHIQFSEPPIESDVAIASKLPYAIVSIVPLRRNPNTGAVEKLVSFGLDINPIGRGGLPSSPATFADNSVLNTGTWYKVGIVEDGLYKLTPQFLQSIGIDVAGLNPQNIRIYGNGGAMLPFDNSVWRPDDLQENAILVVGEQDAVFNADDYVLFYAKGPTSWERSGSEWLHQTNLYSDTAYYFINVDLGAGKRVQDQASEVGTPVATVTSFDDYAYHENDWTNLIKTGRRWYGEYFNAVTEYDFFFQFPNIDQSVQAKANVVFAGRSLGAESVVNARVNSGSVESATIDPVNSCYTCTYAVSKKLSVDFTPSSSTVDVRVDYQKGISSAIGWLDYIEVMVRRQLKMAGNQVIFRDYETVGAGLVEFQFSNNSSSTATIWEVTTPYDASNQLFETGTSNFRVTADTLRQFVAFTGSDFPVPAFAGTVANQNLHAVAGVDMVIVTHPKFLAQAEQLAAFHTEEVIESDQLNVAVVTTQQVYNEFSSGAQDLTAIKDFMRMLYEDAGGNPDAAPKYLLLFGDGSYDMKDRISGNTNFIPTFQSDNSWKPTESYTSDDYFGLLDPNEAARTTDLVDVGIGRLPVKSVAEAQAAVNKIKHYYDNRTFGSWRNWVAFIGDDEDNNVHMRDANRLATFVDTTYEAYNVDKIYFDAYPQQSTPGGQRYPDVNDAIDERMDKGALIVTYVGHGGELGWAHERVLEISQINNWTNTDNLPLFVTATCEFSRYDDPQRTSAGELVFLNPDGGSIGLLTTTRLVYSTPNYELARQFFNHAFVEVDGLMPTLGYLTRATKINGPANINSRNFTLLGDPALRLAYPEYGVVTTAVPDTIGALGKITVSGYVVDENGDKLDGFNGTIYPVVFDKSSSVESLNNDNNGTYSFSLRKNILFKGKASVSDGDFSFTFVVPRDIAYTFGAGKISYYFEDGVSDGHGYTTDFIVGGSATGVATDTKGPDAELYMNDESFVFGGLTDDSPDMLAYVFDENGINTVGSGIGHDIVAVLDENTAQAIVLNDFYESDLDSYQSGSIRYPFSKLEQGTHTLSLKVWDVYNNSGEAYTEFLVAESAELALSHVLNYPNPFTTNTGFYFEHNRPGQTLDIKIEIFTVSGKLVKTIDTYATSDGFRIGPIAWNGLDEYQDKIGKGVYLYKLRVLAPDGETADQFEKLVILN